VQIKQIVTMLCDVNAQTNESLATYQFASDQLAWKDVYNNVCDIL